ncbi:MAG: DUF3883 domain-containing protein [Candidatus Eisenbacteria bacterium]|nr:DUF3883 domain-containing protein [Candidatus Eisenbacteria bacterium]
MPAQSRWSTKENVETIRAYFAMLAAELQGQAYKKADYRRQLEAHLEGRSSGAIDFKWGNISAVLNELRFPTIAGFKEAPNYQAALFTLVENFLESNPAIHQMAAQSVEEGVYETVAPENPLLAQVEPPSPESGRSGRPHNPIFGRGHGQFVDYLERERRNSLLGAAGEEFVMRFEIERLKQAGKNEIAEQVVHVSKTIGDGAGYDIHSFDDEAQVRLIEVKTTAFGQSTPFYISQAEATFSQANDSEYWIYRVFAFRTSPRLFCVKGDVSQQFSLSPSVYLARLRG